MWRNTLPILRQTSDWIAIEKPAGLAVIPGRAETDSVLEMLARQLNVPATGSADPRVRVVHRLDKETSGVLLFALNRAAQRHLCSQFQHNEISKEYVALVNGRLHDDRGEIEAAIGVHPTNKLKMAVVKHGGRPAKTDYLVMERYRDFTLVRLFPKTGKTHQIRVHMTHLGHPLAIDPLYFAGRNADGLFLSRFKRDYRPSRDQEERPLIARLPLHAERLRFADMNGEPVELHSPLPKDFRAVVNMLSKHGK